MLLNICKLCAKKQPLNSLVLKAPPIKGIFFQIIHTGQKMCAAKN
jgi:hypothetical protein